MPLAYHWTELEDLTYLIRFSKQALIDCRATEDVPKDKTIYMLTPERGIIKTTRWRIQAYHLLLQIPE